MSWYLSVYNLHLYDHYYKNKAPILCNAQYRLLAQIT